MTEDEDRLFELTLLEAAGGETPPNLSQQILSTATAGDDVAGSAARVVPVGGVADSAVRTVPVGGVADSTVGSVSGARVQRDAQASLADSPANLADAPANLADAPANPADAPATLADPQATPADSKANLADSKANLADSKLAESDVRVDVIERRDLSPVEQDLSAKWARPGKLRRWRRTRRLAATAGASLMALGLAAWGHSESRERLRLEHLAQLRSGLQDLVESDLRRVEAELRTGRAALRAERADAALEAAERASAIVEGLEANVHRLEPRSPRRAGVELATTRLAIFKARAEVLEATTPVARVTDYQFTAAKEHLHAIRDRQQKTSELWARATVALGELNLLVGQIADAKDLFEAIPDQYGSMRAVRLGLARCHFERGELDEARHALTRVIASLDEPSPVDDRLDEEQAKTLHAYALVQRSRAFLRDGFQVNKALRDAKAARALNAGWRAHACLGDVLRASGDLLAAEDAYAAAIAASASLGSAVVARARVARAEGLLAAGGALRVRQAVEDAETALSLDPTSLRARLVRGNAAEQQLDFERARDDARSVVLAAQANITQWREAAEAELLLARLDFMEGDVPAAHEHAKRARTLREYSIAAKLLQAQIELDSFFEGQYLDSAERLFKLVLRAQPQSLEAMRGIGLALEQKFPSQPERAERKLDAALELDPRDVETLCALARVHVAKAKKRPAQSASLLDAAKHYRAKAARMSRDPRRAAGLAYAIGLEAELAGQGVGLHRQAEHFDRAQRSYRRCLFLVPHHTLARLGLMRIARSQMSYSREKKHLLLLLAQDPDSPATIVANAELLMRSAIERGQATDPAAGRAIEKALDTLGATPELTLLKAQWAAGEQTSPEQAIAAFDQHVAGLRDTTHAYDVLRAEHQLVRWLEERHPSHPEIRRRYREAGERLIALRHEEGTRETMVRKAYTNLQKVTPVTAGTVQEMEDVVAKAPRVAGAWDVLSRLRSQAGTPTGTLAAALRAGHLDADFLPSVLSLLTTLSLEVEDLGDRDDDVLALPADIVDAVNLILSARTGAKVDTKLAKTVFAALESKVIEDPTHLLRQLLLGLLAYHVRRDEYAVQHLAFAGSAANLGEAYYLAAAVEARAKGRSDRHDAAAIDYLQAASKAGFDWREPASKNRAFEALRASSAWKRLR